ncbi:hypothetical protein ACHAWT_000178 [Skeletonema menzelii]
MELIRGDVGNHTGYVLDNALSPFYMSKLQNLRTSLPIDKEKKKTAAARRFLCAEDELEWIRVGLVAAIRQGLLESDEELLCSGSGDTNYHGNELIIRVLPWMRFLEYITPNGSLGPHTDALIRCKETDVWSTHTLLVFCSDCELGGETTLLPEDAKTTRLRNKKMQKAKDAAAEVRLAISRIDTSFYSQQSSADDGSNGTNFAKLVRLKTTLQTIEANISTMNKEAAKPCFPVKPKCGRILFFPHECPHEGRPTVSVPKIFLRAELILKRKR